MYSSLYLYNLRKDKQVDTHRYSDVYIHVHVYVYRHVDIDREIDTWASR